MASQQSMNASFERSEQLQAEWNRIRFEIQETDPADPEHAPRRAALQRRMQEIKTEMASVVTQTRGLISSPDSLSLPSTGGANNNRDVNNNNVSTTIDDAYLPPIVSGDEDDEYDDDDMRMASAHQQNIQTGRDDILSSSSARNASSAIPVQYSARRRHVVQRTYDSTSSSSASSLKLDAALAQRNADDVDLETDTASLRRQLMQGAEAGAAVVTVEHRASRGHHLAGLRRGLRGALRGGNGGSESSASTKSAVLPPSDANCSVSTVDSALTPSPPPFPLPTESSTRTTSQTPRTPSSPPAAPTPPSSVPDDDPDNLDDLTVPQPLEALSQDQCEKLAREQSRLERESRRLRRKPERSKQDQLQLLDIASRLSKLSSTLADASVKSNGFTGMDTSSSSNAGGSSSGGGGRLKSLLLPTARTQQQTSPQQPPTTSPPPPPPPSPLPPPSLLPPPSPAPVPSPSSDTTQRLGLARQGSQLQHHRKGIFGVGGKTRSTNAAAAVVVTSPLTDDGVANQEHAARYSTAHPAKTPSGGGGKRKKTWLALEAGMAPFKAFGRTVRNTALASRGDSTPSASSVNASSSGDASHSTSGNGAAASIPSSKTPSSRQGRKSNVAPLFSDATRKRQSGTTSAFAELSERLAQRSEKLGAAADASEQMASDAGDMLSAARALRQRQQKGAFS